MTVAALRALLNEIDTQGGPEAARQNRLRIPDDEGTTSPMHATTTPTPDLLAARPVPTAHEEAEAMPVGQLLAWANQRDDHNSHGTNDHEMYDAIDALLDQYQLHADTGTPLGEHVCEGRAVGDCERLEPAAGAEDAPPVRACPPGCVACATDESHDPAPAAGAEQGGEA